MIVKGYMIYMARMALIIKFEAGKVFIIIIFEMLPKTKRPKTLPRKLTLSDDDPFSKIFDKASFEQELANPTVTKRCCKMGKNVQFGSESGSLNDSEADL